MALTDGTRSWTPSPAVFTDVVVCLLGPEMPLLTMETHYSLLGGVPNEDRTLKKRLPSSRQESVCCRATEEFVRLFSYRDILILG